MIRKELYRWLLLIGVLFVGISCTDDEIVSSTEIGKGEALIQAEVSFKPFAQGLEEDSRTPGDAIKEIKNLCVLVYDEAGTALRGSYYYEPGQQASESQYKITEEQRADADADNRKKAEDKTQHAEFKLKLPYGVYRIYAVANMGNLADTYKDQINNVEALKSISLSWNASDISANNQMFGYFTVQGATSTTDEKVVINQTSPTLHAWIKRAASKVTVAFDGNNLNENVYIYIHSVQIKDIPKTCLLGKDNTPEANSLIANGETINYRSTTSNDDGLTITKGAPTGGKINSSEEGGVHHEAANALFFYENMAGTTADKGKWQDADGDKVIDNPNGNTETDPDYKDGVKTGTYIEVKGYYVNKNSGKASQGPITYRFMMGKDVDKDCNAERNYHYKLTLMFNKDANDADWHIVYDVEDPGINVPSPMYISYLHGEKLDIPVVITGGSVTDFKAEIVDNNWEYDGHPYLVTGGNDYNYNGFLTLKDTRNSTEVAADNRQSDFEENDSGTYSASLDQGTNTYTYNVPVYTREVYLGHGFSGNNSYMHKERKAKVKFTATINGKEVSKEVEIIQVKRVINPAGVWRPYNNTDDFRVTLMELNEESASGDAFEAGVKPYEPTFSDGPWTASIVQGNDWVRIRSVDGNWGTTDVIGSTGSKIDFYYKPIGTIGIDQTRCGVIKITYHNNTCVHYVFVSQGDAPVTMGTGTNATRWHTKNVKYKGHEVDNPVHEGSLFRFHNSEYAIIPENNYRTGFGPFENNFATCTNSTGVFKVLNSSGNIEEKNWPIADDGYNTYIGSRESEYALRINFDNSYERYNNGSRGDEFEGIMGNNAKVASVEQWNALKQMKRYYGVLYGEYARTTKTNASDMYEYPFDSNGNAVATSDKGMRGMFVWDRDGSKGHLFFPLGAKGHGHRAQFPDWNQSANVVSYREVGTLQYSNMSEKMARPSNNHRPLLIDLYLAWGAIYWCSNWDSANGDDDYSDSGGSTVTQTGGQNAMDINFNTYDFNTYMEHATWRNQGRIGTWFEDGYGRDIQKTVHDETFTQSSDACFIRCVEK